MTDSAALPDPDHLVELWSPDPLGRMTGRERSVPEFVFFLLPMLGPDGTSGNWNALVCRTLGSFHPSEYKRNREQLETVAAAVVEYSTGLPRGSFRVVVIFPSQARGMEQVPFPVEWRDSDPRRHWKTGEPFGPTSVPTYEGFSKARQFAESDRSRSVRRSRAHVDRLTASGDDPKSFRRGLEAVAYLAEADRSDVSDQAVELIEGLTRSKGTNGSKRARKRARKGNRAATTGAARRA